MKTHGFACGLLGMMLCGCSEPTAPKSGEQRTTPSPWARPRDASDAEDAQAEDADERPSSQAGQEPREAASEPAKKIRPSDKVKKAQVGVGKRGRGYGGGLVTEPIRVRFHAEERINFLMIEKNLKLFRALHDRLPKSHEEFMTEIIKKGAVRLPELPDGEEYVYDPERGDFGELMVRRPR